MNISNKIWAKIGSIIIFSLVVIIESNRLIKAPEYPSRLYFIVIFSIFLGIVIGDVMRGYKEQKKYK